MAIEAMIDIATVEMIITALTADYKRRAEAIEKNVLPVSVIMEYKYYNTKIYNAVAEIVGESQATSYIEDIGGRRGYSKRPDLYLSENMYYKKKNECKRNIARALKLID